MDGEKLVSVEGTKGESLFHKALTRIVTPEGAVEAMQSEVASALEKVEKTGDERALALVGALLVENAVQKLLASVMPAHDDLLEHQNVTFSVQIEIALALRHVPKRILRSAHVIRKIRNEFAHDLELDEFSKVTEKLRRQMHARAKEFKEDGAVAGNDLKTFSNLAVLVVLALRVHSLQTGAMDEYLRSDQFMSAFDNWLEQNPRA